MDLGLQGRTALVLASTGGLGRATAEALGREGANVVVTGRRLDAAEEVASRLPSAIGVALDVRDATSRQAAVRATQERFGAVDVLVINGPGPKPQTAAALSADEAGTAFDDLVRPGVDLISQVLPGMRERRWGRVLAIGSSGVVAPLAGLVTSNLGRAALAGYLKTLAGEVAADGVTVNLLLPGRIATARVDGLDRASADRQGLDVDEVRRRSALLIPAHRYGEPEEFGAMAAVLCGGIASYVTGAAIRCDGGLVQAL